MAKLSAHGTEVARLVRDKPDGQDVMSIRSDRYVLMNFILIREDGTRQSGTWKIAGRIKEGHTESYIGEVQDGLGYKKV